jgi:hypothetical protein
MYPIDLLKVLIVPWSFASSSNPPCADTNASREPFAHRRVLRHIQRHGHNHKSRGLPDIMERSVKCGSGRRSVADEDTKTLAETNVPRGPAHAVYFATYEWVKHAMGGNEGLKTDHHPLAAGKRRAVWIQRSIRTHFL